MSEYGVLLFDHHAQLLADSAVSVEVARERGYRSVDRRKQLGQVGFTSPQQRIPGLLIPIYDETGNVALHQFRPDQPRTTQAGRSVKYETPSKARMTVDVPPRVQAHLGNPARPLWITEGVRKADAAVTAGLDCLALLGVWNWRGRNDYDAATALAFWESVALKGRRIYLCFDSDVMLKESVHAALVRLGAFLGHRGAKLAYVYLPSGDGGKVGLDDFLAAGGTVAELVQSARSEPIKPPGPQPEKEPVAEPKPERPARSEPIDGAQVLNAVGEWISRYLAVPSPHYLTVITLWAAHTHCVQRWYVTPRLVIDSAEPESGKTRVLELLALLVADPELMLSPTVAAIFRLLAAGPRTILLDETDAIFAVKNATNYEDLRALLNSGYKRGAAIPRCVGDAAKMQVQRFPVFAPAALAGLAGGMPRTILTRAAAVLHMRKRSPNEPIEQYDGELAENEAEPLRGDLADWVDSIAQEITTRPDLPAGVTDRSAECWRPLIALANAAGGNWPQDAAEACTYFVHGLEPAEMSLGVRLLRDLRNIFNSGAKQHSLDASGRDRMTTVDILAGLRSMEEAPWGDMWGKPLDARRLAKELDRYEVKPVPIRVGDKSAKGYVTYATTGQHTQVGLADAWARHLPDSAGDSGDNGDTAGQNANEPVTDPEPIGDSGDTPVTCPSSTQDHVTDVAVTEPLSVTPHKVATSTVADVTDVTANSDPLHTAMTRLAEVFDLPDLDPTNWRHLATGYEN